MPWDVPDAAPDTVGACVTLTRPTRHQRTACALHHEQSRLGANIVDRRLSDISALPPSIVDMAADHDPRLATAHGIAQRHAAVMPAVLLPVGDAMGRRVRNQHRTFRALLEQLRRLAFIKNYVPGLGV